LSKKHFDEDELTSSEGGNTPVDHMMEDTPSNYNFANQRFEHNYYEVDEIEEDGKEEVYDSFGKRLPKTKLKKKL
jgi:hypothetical protein